MDIQFKEQESFTDLESFDDYVNSWRIDRPEYIVYNVFGTWIKEKPDDIVKRTDEIMEDGIIVYQLTQAAIELLEAEELTQRRIAELSVKICYAI